MHESISILGCGWFGAPFGSHLADAGWTVRGSTTTSDRLSELEAEGIDAHRVELHDEFAGEDVEAFLGSPVLMLSIPPPRTDDREGDHRAQIRALVEAVDASPVEWVLMTSSTSVYPNANRVVEEDDAGSPEKESGRAVWAAEELLREAPFDFTAVRFAGLYGYGRHPAKYLAGRTGLTHGGRPVNLVHRDDCVGAARHLLEEEARNTAFNVVADQHPTRAECYTVVAQRLGLDPPEFEDHRERPYKTVSNRRIREELGYEFAHPDPIERAP